jgi:hypothetical protein
MAQRGLVGKEVTDKRSRTVVTLSCPCHVCRDWDRDGE